MDPKVKTPGSAPGAQSPTDSDDQKSFLLTRACWDGRVEEKQTTEYVIRSWSESEFIVREYINRTISGRTDSNWFTWSAENFILSRPVERVLDLGCGTGAIERHGCAINVGAHFDAYDISETSIDEAQRLASKSNISDRVTYRVGDFLTIPLSGETYDVVYMDNSLHHCFDVPMMLERVEHVLKPEGLLILNEFVGPDRFQWTDAQLAAANTALACLSERYRTMRSGGVRRSIVRSTVEHMIATDPSEAAHSSQIVPEIARRFTEVARRDWGGTVLHPLLQEIVHNFNPVDSDADATVLRLLMAYEAACIGTGQLSSDFAVFVLKKDG